MAAATAWVTLSVAARVGNADSYALVAVVWSLYYGVIGLTAGIQQELTLRSSAPAPGAGPPALVAVLAVALPLVVVGGVLSLSADLGGSSSRHAASTTVLAGIAMAGGTCWVLVLGRLAVEHDATRQAGLIVWDATARLVAVLLAVVAGPDSLSMWAAMAASAWTWLPWGWRTFARAVRVRAPFLPLVRGSLLLMTSAAGTSVLLAGMPTLIVLVSDPGMASPGLLVALVLLRSPLMVIVLAYRPVLLAWWAGSVRPARTETMVIVGGCAVAVLAAGLAGLAGPTLLASLAGQGFRVDAVTSAVLVASAVLMGVAVVITMARAAAGAQAAASASWVLAVGATVVALALGPSGEAALAATCLVGPAVFLGVALLSTIQSSPREKADSRSWRE